MNHHRQGLPTRWIVATALLAALSFVVSLFEIPMPLSPSYIKLDFSDVPALIGAFAYGPIAGVMIELVKNLIALLTTNTGGVGQLANFSIGSAMMVVAGSVYRVKRTRKGAMIGIFFGAIAMGLMAMVMNYYVLLPLFSKFMPLDVIIETYSKILPIIKTKFDIVLYNALPFSFFKGIVCGAITMLLYKKLRPLLKGE